MSAEEDDDHEATLARKCAKAFRVLAEMSHKGGAEAQVVERAGNDLEGGSWGSMKYSPILIFPLLCDGK